MAMGGSPASTPPTSPSFSFGSSSSPSHSHAPSGSGSHYTSDEQPNLGAFNLVLREYGYMLPGPRIPAYHSVSSTASYASGSGSGRTETQETYTYRRGTQTGTSTEMEEGRRSTVWAHEPIAQYLNSDDDFESDTDTDTTSRSVAIETASAHSQSLSSVERDDSSGPLTLVDDYTLTLRTQPSPQSSSDSHVVSSITPSYTISSTTPNPAVEFEFDFDFGHDPPAIGAVNEQGDGPSLGYLDQALSFIAAERAQLALRSASRRVPVVGPPLSTDDPSDIQTPTKASPTTLTPAPRRKRRKRKPKLTSTTNNILNTTTTTTGTTTLANDTDDNLLNPDPEYDYTHHEEDDDDEDGYAEDEHESPHPPSSSSYPESYGPIRYPFQSKSTPMTPRPRAPSPLSPASPISESLKAAMTGSVTPASSSHLTSLALNSINILSSSDSPFTGISRGNINVKRKRSRPKKKITVVGPSPTITTPADVLESSVNGVPDSSSHAPPAESLHALSVRHARSSPMLRQSLRDAETDHSRPQRQRQLVTDTGGEAYIDAATRRILELGRYLGKIAPAERAALKAVERKIVVEAKRRWVTRLGGKGRERTEETDGSDEEEEEDGENYLDPRGRAPDRGRGDPPVHIFVDHSNILFGLLTYLKRHPTTLRNASTANTHTLGTPIQLSKTKAKSTTKPKAKDTSVINNDIDIDVGDDNFVSMTTTGKEEGDDDDEGGGGNAKGSVITTPSKKTRREKMEKGKEKEKEKGVIVPKILTRPKGVATTATTPTHSHSYSTSSSTVGLAHEEEVDNGVGAALPTPSATPTPIGVATVATTTTTPKHAKATTQYPTQSHTTPIPLPSFATALSSPTLAQSHPQQPSSSWSSTTPLTTNASLASVQMTQQKRARSRPRKARKQGQGLQGNVNHFGREGVNAVDVGTGTTTMGERGGGVGGEDERSQGQGPVSMQRHGNMSISAASDDVLLMGVGGGGVHGVEGKNNRDGDATGGEEEEEEEEEEEDGRDHDHEEEDEDGLLGLPGRARRRLRRQREREARDRAAEEEEEGPGVLVQTKAGVGKDKENENREKEGKEEKEGEGENVKEKEKVKLKLKMRPRARHLSHTALALVLERGRAVSRRVAVTSSPLYQPIDTLERLGYEVRVFARVPDLGDGMDRTAKLSKHKRHLSGGGTTSGGDASGSPGTSPFKSSHMTSHTSSHTSTSHSTAFSTPTSHTHRVKFREQGVDELLQLKLHQALAAEDDVPPGATIVLATGDGNVGQFNEDGFLGPVRTALKRGWRVELYAWEDGLSRAWRREFGLGSEWSRNGMFQIIGMEQFAGSLVKGGL